MNRKKLFSLAISLLLTLFLALPSLGALRVMTESFPPFNYSADEKIKGISVELLQETLRILERGIEDDAIELMPWARAYNIVTNQPDTVLFSMARTADREEHFKWAGPIYRVTIGAIALKSRAIKAATATDLNKYKIGSVRDGAPEELIIKAGIDPGSLDRSGDSLSNIRKLANGRIDVFAFPLPVARHLMKQEGLNPDDFEIVLTLKEVALYYSFNKETDDEFIARFQKALDSLEEAGAGGRSFKDLVIEKYLGSSN